MTISVTNTAGASNTASVSMTVSAGCKILVACAMSSGGMSISSFTHGSDALTFLCGSGEAQIWYRKNPTAQTATLSYSYTGGYWQSVAGITFSGEVLNISGTYENDLSVTVSTDSGDWVVGAHDDGDEERDNWQLQGTAIIDTYFDPGSGQRHNHQCGYVQASGTSTTWAVGTDWGRVHAQTAVARIYSGSQAVAGGMTPSATAAKKTKRLLEGERRSV